MKTYYAKIVAQGLAFPEGPRWHEDRLWFTDQHGRAVYAMDSEGNLDIVIHTKDLPGGLGWLPDGTMVVVYMTARRLMRLSGTTLTEHADLSELASFHCNDMVADRQGRIYVGNFGFDLHGGASVRNAEIILVDADGSPELFTKDVVFPNGSAITPDGGTLLVAETFAHRITAFRLDPEGRLSSRDAFAKDTWAELGPATPDGICLDADDALWMASPGTRELIRITQGGDRLARCETAGTPYACMLGGTDRRTLYVCTSETDSPEDAPRLKSGRIEQVRVEMPGVGLP